MASAISFQGLSTNLQTDALVNAIIQQESAPLTRMQSRQTLNSQRSTVLQSINSALLAFNTSYTALSTTAMQSRAVSSSDANGTYASATASGASAGTYDLAVSQVATRAKLDNTSFAVADAATTKVFDDSTKSSATFAIQGSDGTVKTFTLDAASNNLNGLRDAINASQAGITTTGGGVNATVVKTGTGATPYRMIISANDTGTGTTSGKLTLAEVTTDPALNTLGIAAGTLDDPGTPTTITGGTRSALSQVAVDAEFTLNGVAMTRTTNVVTDAADGLTLTLKKGDATGTVTTFTVGLDKSAIATAASDVVSKFNTAYNAFKNASGTGGPLAGDMAIRSLFSRIRSAFTAVPTGVSLDSTYNSAPALGFKTNQDGTLGVDTTVLQAALDADVTQVQAVFTGSRTATKSLVEAITAPGSGNLAQTLSAISQQNYSLSRQITDTQARLERRRTVLQNQFTKLESAVGQLQAAGQSLSAIR